MGRNIDTPSGIGGEALKRDLSAGRRVPVWRPEVCVVRAMPDLGDRILRFVLATPGVKRDGHSVATEPEAWELEDFKRNPVALWCHDYGSEGRPPLPKIGEWPNVEFERVDGKWHMVGDLRFASWELPELLYRMHLPREKGGDGMRGASSIGWTPLEAHPNEYGGFHMTRNALNEASLVNIGADPLAVQRMAQSGKVPEKIIDLIVGANRIFDAAKGRAYVLDWQDRIEISTKPETRSDEPEGDPEPQKDDTDPQEPEVRILEDDSVVFERVKDDVGIVLVCDGKADKKTALRQWHIARSAFSEKKSAELDPNWRAIPVLPGKPMRLARFDGRTEGRDAILRDLKEALEKGEPVVLPAGWTLARSERSDRLDVLYAQLVAFAKAAKDPIERLWWAVNDVFLEDEAEAERPFGSIIPIEKRAKRELNLIQNLFTSALDVCGELELALEPEPSPVGESMTASRHVRGYARVGKKMAKHRLERTKKIDAHLHEARTLVAEILEECDAECRLEDQAASGSAEITRLIAELGEGETRTDDPKPDPEPEKETESQRSSIADLARMFEPNEPTRSALGALAESLQGGA